MTMGFVNCGKDFDADIKKLISDQLIIEVKNSTGRIKNDCY